MYNYHIKIYFNVVDSCANFVHIQKEFVCFVSKSHASFPAHFLGKGATCIRVYLIRLQYTIQGDQK